MKDKYIYLLILVGLLTICIDGNAQNTKNMYKAKSGIIEFEMTGKTTGKEIMYFDDYGRKEATFSETTTKVLGMTSSENTLEIRKDSILYMIDLEEKTGIRTVIPFDPSEMTEEQMKELEDTGKKMLSDLGFEKIGEEKILGRNCDIWEGLGTKIWIWENLSLKTEVNMMGQWTTEAVKIDLNSRIDPGKFKVPAGIEMTNEDYVFGEDGEMDEVGDIDGLDSLASEVGKELEKGLNELKSILGLKKKKKKK